MRVTYTWLEGESIILQHCEPINKYNNELQLKFPRYCNTAWNYKSYTSIDNFHGVWKSGSRKNVREEDSRCLQSKGSNVLGNILGEINSTWSVFLLAMLNLINLQALDL